MTDELSQYVATWRSAVEDFLTLCEQVPADAWTAPSPLPGWDALACLAHTAHLEAVANGSAHEDVEIGDAPHVTGSMGQFTEQGVVARRGRTPAELIDELRTATAARSAALAADPPTDPEAPAPGVFGLIGWPTRVFLRNRPLDVWMHEQDIRDATGLPGDEDTAAARHSTEMLLRSLPMVLGKRAGAGPGQSLVLTVTGHGTSAWEVGADGRAGAIEPPTDPTVTLTMDRATFVRLAGGRRARATSDVTIAGDAALAGKILDAMAVTP